MQFEKNLKSYLKNKHNLIIGERIAEEFVKQTNNDCLGEIDVSGRDSLTGKTKTVLTIIYNLSSS